ncbi:nucleoside-diphosphate sugar epimerase/dehydratase [Flavobacterium sp. J27]|uniref:polysaccharide biosynthesis protein n=1 Tax=Flavobacterium sp. J27 TaxID=2060419 RepID=UPI0010316E58|nr:nucleoside-diphosphate sugar epimerase/dehydratase [Flavobacterium sp. J27]
MIKLNEKLFSIGYLPRWIIFCIDIGILVLANALTHIILINLTLGFYDTISLSQQYLLILLVNIVFFRVFKTFSGIIRHSTFIDAVKLFFASFCSFLVLSIFNYGSFIIFQKKIFLFPGLIISFVLSFTFLFFFRLLVKFAFEINTIDSKTLIRTVVYGSDANAIAVANAVKSEIPARFKIVAFLDKSRHNKSKSILGLPILYKNKKASVLLRSLGAKTLILAEKSLTKDEKIRIVDDCLENNIKVYVVPIISDWENKTEISKKIKNFEIQDLLERKPIILDNKLISKQISNKTILITGGAGSIGSEIVWQVLEFNPQRIIIFDQAESPLHKLCIEILKFEKRIEIVPLIGDIRNKVVLKRVFEKYQPSMVYHAAAYKHVPLMEENPSEAIFTNVLGTKNLADLSLEYNVKKFVMVSTDKAVNPSNVMGASKRIAEKYVQSLYFKFKNDEKKVTKFITTRFGNVLGSNGSVVPLFSEQIQKGGPITITHPKIIRYFMTIPEACQLVLEAGSMGKGGEIYIFDMGKPVKIIDLAKKMIQLAGYEPYKDIDIEVIGLRPGEKLYEELLNDTSKTLPTHHDKIMICQELDENYEENLIMITNLIDKAKFSTDLDIVSEMKKIIPEFKSMNSIYECLDK